MKKNISFDFIIENLKKQIEIAAKKNKRKSIILKLFSI